jgi:hypothetical protein
VITIYGAGDDLIEVDGDISEEFYVPDLAANGDLLAFSDGTVLRLHITNEGIWRITPVVRGAGYLSIVQAPEDDDDNITDRATLDGAVWVVHGTSYAGVVGVR